jgi:hypothetical protein
VVVDVAGPGRRVITGLDLRVLADLLDLEAVEALVRAALADLAAPSGDSPVEFRVRDARNDLDQGAPIDVLVELDVRAGGGPAADPSGNLAETAAGVLAERRDIQRLVPGGLGVAMASASSVRPR